MSKQKKLWVERSGIHTTQAFYSVEYPFDNAAEVEKIVELLDRYSRWVKVLYDAVRQGVPHDELPAMPDELRFTNEGVTEVAEKQVRNKKT